MTQHMKIKDRTSKRPAVQYATGKKSFKHKERLEKAMKVRKKQKKIKRGV